MTKIRKTPKSLQDFQKNEEGAIAILFGLSCVLLVGLIGLGLDGSRAMGAQAKTASALDAAALAATRAIVSANLDDAEVEELANRFYHDNLLSDGNMLADYGTLDVQIDRDTRTIRLAVETHVPTLFGRIFGVKSIDFWTDTAATFNVHDIELGLALDLTGSMGGQKIADLRLAAGDLVDMLIPDNGAISDVKIGLAPYSAYVNAGTYAAFASGDAAPPSSCMFERDTSEIYTDALPDTGDFLGVESDGRRVANNCPGVSIEPLTNNKQALHDKIDLFNAQGSTAGHIGLAWAWYMVSPTWASVWPEAPKDYGTRNLTKAIVLMTDGVFNTQYVPGATSSQQALEICDNIKAEGVLIYSVAFQAPGSAQTMLETCASTDENGDKLYYDAANGTELRKAFKAIAVSLTNLRLAQ
ncbi:MAG: pilus assembly protein TadG-related protein [Hyphomicrobiaceae bacterium]